MKPITTLKKVVALAAMSLGLWGCKQPKSGAALLPNYNTSFYPTVLQATEGIGMPFFLQEHVDTMAGVTVVRDSFLMYQGATYTIFNNYENPDSVYYIAASNYANYGINAATAALWPAKIPNALYNKADSTFNSTVDCVGYGTRILAATGSGGADSTNNAYVALGAFVRGTGAAPFAAHGWVASAYQIAIAFPLLPAAGKLGWQYVSGNVITQLIDSVNNRPQPNWHYKKYTGVAKGGFANAQPGDVLSFGYDGGKSNGHFMVMAKAPQKLTSAQFSAYFAPIFQTQADSLSSRLQVYGVTVYDCSGQNIHFNDSRKFMSGIGRGTLFIFTDIRNDIPQGFIFEPPHASSAQSGPVNIGAKLMGAPNVATCAISVGRYTMP